MMTIVTHVHLKEGAGRDWDAAMGTRLSAVNRRPGWVGGQLLRPADNPNRRVIVGTWRTRADWEAWHHDPQFTETRQRLDGLESAPAEHWWHVVTLDVRKPSTSPPPTSKSPSQRRAKGKTKRKTKRKTKSKTKSPRRRSA
jgi:heme-degrading monooxygenase HmoA